MEAVLLYFDDCPNWQQTASHLDRLTSEFPDLKVTRQFVDTDEAAQRLGFLGSPTVRLDGVDLFAASDTPVGLSCRIYMTPNGPAGSPTLEQLRDALASASGRVEESSRMRCSCCGEQRDMGSLAALLCHDDIKICKTCVGWLMQQAGGVDVTPTLPVSDMDAAEEFYRRAGFEVRRYDDGFAFVTLDDQSVFDLGVDTRATPTHNAAGCYIISADTDAWHDRLVAAGLPATQVEAKPWGMREFSLADPSGNTIRIGKPLGPGADA